MTQFESNLTQIESKLTQFDSIRLNRLRNTNGNTNTYLASSLNTSYKLPSIGEFLSNLDQKYNCDNVYAKFEEAFGEEEITVNAIKDLSDEQLQKLGVVKIGWQKNIKQAHNNIEMLFDNAI